MDKNKKKAHTIMTIRQRKMLREMFKGGPFEALLNLIERVEGKSGEYQLSLLEKVDREWRDVASPAAKDIVARLLK